MITKNRIEAFSDGVIAIIITIMVLELKAPHEPTAESLRKLAPILCSYVLSFLVVAIMWVNHHHLMHAARVVTPGLLWWNLHLLFWMSLIPFVTAWMGNHPSASLPVSLYGMDLGFCGLAFTLLRWELVRQVREQEHRRAHHRRLRVKNIVSFLLYFSAAGLAWVSVPAAYAILVMIPLAYFLPDRGDVEV